MKNRTESFIGLASSDDLRIALHYKEAAQILYNSAAYQDGITLPFLFLVRQYLELSLKYNIKKLNKNSSCNNLVADINREHDLNKIHTAFIAHYTDVKNDKNIINLLDEKLLKDLDTLISKISLLDTKSQGFRYALNTFNQKIIGHEETFNLKYVYDLLDNTNNLLTHTEEVFNLNP